MEDVGSIGMNVDRVFVEVIEAISADVIFSIDVPTNKIFMTTPFEIN